MSAATMKEILLTSEASVKGLTAISDNVESKYLLPAIREAQEIYLREIIGDPLLAKLKWCVDNDAFRGSFSTEAFNESFQADTGSNQPYKNLLDKIQYYLAYISRTDTADGKPDTRHPKECRFVRHLAGRPKR